MENHVLSQNWALRPSPRVSPWKIDTKGDLRIGFRWNWSLFTDNHVLSKIWALKPSHLASPWQIWRGRLRRPHGRVAVTFSFHRAGGGKNLLMASTRYWVDHLLTPWLTLRGFRGCPWLSFGHGSQRRNQPSEFFPPTGRLGLFNVCIRRTILQRAHFVTKCGSPFEVLVGKFQKPCLPFKIVS